MHENERLQGLLHAHAPYFQIRDDGRIECTLNNHAFPPKVDVIEAFIKGKKYQKMKMRREAEENLSKYEPFITQSLNFQNMLFCALTNQLIHKSKDAIREHMKGKRFLIAKERFQNDALELWEEPSPEEMKAFEEAMEAEERTAAQDEEIEGNHHPEDNEDAMEDFAAPVEVLKEEEERRRAVENPETLMKEGADGVEEKTRANGFGLNKVKRKIVQTRPGLKNKKNNKKIRT